MKRTQYFKAIKPIPFEGKGTDNPLAFRYYNARQKVGKRTMDEHLRFAVAWWHSFGATGTDRFGAATKNLPWLSAANPVQRGLDKIDAGFEFMSLLGINFYCFHDYDLVEEGNVLRQSE